MMKKIEFYKYHGAGNDFVVIDNRLKNISLDENSVKYLCDRHFGIGADGLMLIENIDNHDFKMRYFNSDGKEASMCGNGGRCIVAFAKSLGIIENSATFETFDGIHSAIISEKNALPWVQLKMSDVDISGVLKGSNFANTGSPHHIEYISDLSNLDVNKAGAEIRYSDDYKAIGGTNVNFVKLISDSKIEIRTYERGVEFETLACGTGSTAAAIISGIRAQKNTASYQVQTLGEILEVSYKIDGNFAREVFLSGPAKEVFKGTINI
ncbi:MAG: diaminopimelate epimerase [Bacteroidetes bacterium CG2_30_33_31]|nr:MAG: diaminopimelate epimerase [Bacteroidetes bacterium CG2_30_33_31]